MNGKHHLYSILPKIKIQNIFLRPEVPITRAIIDVVYVRLVVREFVSSRRQQGGLRFGLDQADAGSVLRAKRVGVIGTGGVLVEMLLLLTVVHVHERGWFLLDVFLNRSFDGGVVEMGGVLAGRPTTVTKVCRDYRGQITCQIE